MKIEKDEYGYYAIDGLNCFRGETPEEVKAKIRRDRRRLYYMAQESGYPMDKKQLIRRD